MSVALANSPLHQDLTAHFHVILDLTKLKSPQTKSSTKQASTTRQSALTVDVPQVLQTGGAQVSDLLTLFPRQRRPTERSALTARLQKLEQEGTHHRVAHHQSAQAHLGEQVREEQPQVVAQSVAAAPRALGHAGAAGTGERLGAGARRRQSMCHQADIYSPSVDTVVIDMGVLSS